MEKMVSNSPQELARAALAGDRYLDPIMLGAFHLQGRQQTSTTYSVTGPQLTATREVFGGLVLRLRHETNSGVLLLEAELHRVSTLRAPTSMILQGRYIHP